MIKDHRPFPKHVIESKHGAKYLQERIKSHINSAGGRNGGKGPVKASYDIPEDQWQVRYQYTSHRKPNMGRRHTAGRTVEDTSDYGTMSRGDQDMECGQLTEAVAGLHLEEEVTIDERRKRIHSVLDEILSVPRLADANLTQKNLSNPGQLKRYLSGSDKLSDRSGRSSGTSSLAPAPHSQPPIRTRSVSVNSLTDTTRTKPIKAIQYNRMGPPVRPIQSQREKPGVRPTQSQIVGHSVPGLNLSRVSSMVSSHKVSSSRSLAEEELSAVQLPNLDMEQPRIFGDDTEAELAICPPSLGETDTSNYSLEPTQTTQLNISTTDNNKVTKKIVSGRSSVMSSSQQQRHRVGTVPKYLKVRQTEWKEAEKKRISEIPDPDCPPGHRLIDKEEKEARIKEMEEEQSSLLHSVSNLPFSVDTRRVRIKRQQIEERLAQLEDRLRDYNRAKVFVKISDVDPNT